MLMTDLRRPLRKQVPVTARSRLPRVEKGLLMSKADPAARPIVDHSAKRSKRT